MTAGRHDLPQGRAVHVELGLLMSAPLHMEGRATRRLAYCVGPHSSVAQASRGPEPHLLDLKV